MAPTPVVLLLVPFGAPCLSCILLCADWRSGCVWSHAVSQGDRLRQHQDGSPPEPQPVHQNHRLEHSGGFGGPGRLRRPPIQGTAHGGLSRVEANKILAELRREHQELRAGSRGNAGGTLESTCSSYLRKWYGCTCHGPIF